MAFTIALENQRDMVPAVVFQTFFRNILAVKQDATLCRHIQPAQQGQQRGLARPGRAEDGVHFPCFQ